jgi:CRISPR-associated protein (Cas_csx3)
MFTLQRVQTSQGAAMLITTPQEQVTPDEVVPEFELLAHQLAQPGTLDGVEGLIVSGSFSVWGYGMSVGLLDQLPASARWLAGDDLKLPGAVVAWSSHSELAVGSIVRFTDPRRAPGAVLALVGTPHSGKTQLRLKYLRPALADVFKRPRSYLDLPSTPDGEGSWFAKVDPSRREALRLKGPHTPEFTEWVLACIDNAERRADLTLFEVGGKLCDNSRQMLRRASGALLLSTDLLGDEARAWRTLVREAGCPLIGEIRSLREGESQLELHRDRLAACQPAPGLLVEGTLARLDRDVASTDNVPCEVQVRALAQLLLDWVALECERRQA